MIAFVNRPRQRDADITRLFGDLVDFHETTPIWLDPRTGRASPAVDLTNNYADLRENVRDWLSRITTSERGREPVAKEITPLVAASVDAAVVFDRRRVDLVYHFRSVTAVCAFAVALILDRRRGLTNRLQRCGWSKCGRFNLDLNPKGRPRRFCLPNHKYLADLETVKERVQKHRQEKL